MSWYRPDLYEVDDPNIEIEWMKLYKDKNEFLKELKDNGFLYSPDHHMFVKNYHDKDERQLVFQFNVNMGHFCEMEGIAIFIEKDPYGYGRREIKRWESQPMSDYDIMMGERLMYSATKMVRDAIKFVQNWFIREKKIALRNEAKNAMKEQDG